MIKTLKLLGLSAILIISMTIMAAKETTVTLPAKENFHLFLLAGQSNMAGRGIIDDEGLTAHPRILALTKSGTWVPAVAPIHFDKPQAGVGLGKAFALALVEANAEITIGLIPAACGGSPISTWEPGGYHTQTKSHPYDDALARAHHAMRSGVLKGILWHQGESDSRTGRAEVYEQKLMELIFRFRNDLEAPELPFIIGQLGQFADKPWSPERNIIDTSHQAVASSLPRVEFVGSEGLTPNKDLVHFDSQSLRKFGRRYAKVYLTKFK